MGLYINESVLFSESDAEESRLKQILDKKFATYFMKDVDFSLGSSFEWNHRPDGNLSVHVSQQAFSEHTASRFGLEDCNRVPLMIPYRSGCPIDSIPDPDPDDPDLPKRKASYQSI